MKKLKLGMEIPIAHLNELGEHTDFDFILAPLVLSHPEYRTYYMHQNEMGRESMLDNGMWEAGGKPPMSFEDLCVVIGMMQPTEVIVPDSFGYAATTIAMAVQWLDYQNWHPVLQNYSYQLVVQGSTMQEAIDCYKRLLDMAVKQNELHRIDHLPVRTIAFPLGVGCKPDQKETWSFMREAILANISLQGEINEYIKIHLMSVTDPAEVLRLRQIPRIPFASLDTGAPIRLGKAGKRYNPLTGKGERIEGYLNPDEKLSHIQLTDAKANISVLKNYMTKE